MVFCKGPTEIQFQNPQTQSFGYSYNIQISVATLKGWLGGKGIPKIMQKTLCKLLLKCTVCTYLVRPASQLLFYFPFLPASYIWNIPPIPSSPGPARLTDAWNALDGDMPDTLLEASKARVDFADLSLLPLYQLLDYLWKEAAGA